MKDQLQHILGQDLYNRIEKFNIPSGKHVVYTSTILRKDDIENPIYLTHARLPELFDDINTEDLGDENGEYIVGDYKWLPVVYSDITFTNLTQINKLGDIYFVTKEGVFELTDVTLDLDGQIMIYEEAVLRN